MEKYNQSVTVSDPNKVNHNLIKYLGKKSDLYLSNRKDKKYFVINPTTNKKIHFGSIQYEDYTKHHDETRRRKYLRRSSNIHGNWKSDPWSPNNLSIHLLWQ